MTVKEDASFCFQHSEQMYSLNKDLRRIITIQASTIIIVLLSVIICVPKNLLDETDHFENT